MRNHCSQAIALSQNRGCSTFFITLTANTYGWSDLKEYLEKIWMFRDAPRPTSVPLQEYDVAGSSLFVAQKFRAIRGLFRCNDPVFWQSGTFDYMVTSTEFQKRSWPHWHMVVRLNLPWNLEELYHGHPDVPAVLEFLSHHITTDSSLTDCPEVQRHSCRHGRCLNKKYKNICKYGFPRFPCSE